MLLELNTQNFLKSLPCSNSDECERLKFYYPKGNAKGCSKVMWSYNVSSQPV